MRAFELLKEGRDAPLYQTVEWYNGVEIIEQNTLKAKSDHYLSKYLDSIFKIPQHIKLSGRMTDEYRIKAVSLTRSFYFAKQWHKSYPPFILILDQSKLAHNYKITPFDFWMKGYAHNLLLQYKQDYVSDNEIKSIKDKWLLRLKQKKQDNFFEAEEIILKDIKNLDKYILGIYTDVEFFKKDQDINPETLEKIIYWSEQPVVKRMK